MFGSNKIIFRVKSLSGADDLGSFLPSLAIFVKSKNHALVPTHGRIGELSEPIIKKPNKLPGAKPVPNIYSKFKFDGTHTFHKPFGIARPVLKINKQKQPV